MPRFICKFLGHKIDRNRVWNDRRDYRTRCRRCASDLLRDVDGWRDFLPEDEREDRLPHPSQRGTA